MDDLTAQERRYAFYIRERLANCRSVLLKRSDEIPLHARLESAYTEGFAATLTGMFAAEAHADLLHEWEGIRDEFTRLGRVTVTLKAMSDPELEALEERILAFVDRYMTETEPDR